MFTTALLACAASHVSEWETFVDVMPGTRLRVLTRATDASLPVLVYQPFATAWPQLDVGDASFLPLTDSFAVATFDPRGIGASTGTFDASVDVQASDLGAVVDRVSPHRKVYVLSISSSACATVRFVRQRPERVEAVVFTAPVVNTDTRKPALAAEIRRVWKVSPWLQSYVPNVAFAVLALARLPYFECHDRWLCTGDFYHPLRYYGAPHYDNPIGVWSTAFDAMMREIDRPLVCDREPVVDVPVYVVTGAHDYGLAPVDTTVSWTSWLRKRNPHVHFVQIDNASHAVHIEHKAAWRDAVRAALPKSKRRVVAALDAPPSHATLHEGRHVLRGMLATGVALLLVKQALS